MTTAPAPLNVDRVFVRAHAVADILKESGVFGAPSDRLVDKLAIDLEHRSFIYKIVQFATQSELPESENFLDLPYNQNSLRLRIRVAVRDRDAIISGIEVSDFWFRSKEFDYAGLEKAIQEMMAYRQL